MPALTFDDLIPAGTAVARTAQPASRGLSFDDLIPPNVGGRSPDASPIDYARDSAAVSTTFGQSPAQRPARPAQGMGQSLLEAEHNNLLAARQRTDPAVYDGGKPLRKKVGVILPEISDIGRVEPGTFITPDNQMGRVDPSKHVVLIDPASGHPTVFERNVGAEGTDATEEPMWKSLGRVILPGFVTSPVSGPARAVNSGSSRATEAAPAAMISQRAQNAAEDLMSFERAQVPVFAPAFSGNAGRATAKGLAETWGIGAPMQNALEATYSGMGAAANRVADSLSPVTTADQAGASLQRGLDRFRTAGVCRDIEPGVLAERGIDPVAPVQPQQVMSRGAQARAAEAAPIRAENAGGMAETARGVSVPAARPLNQTIIARRSVDDMTDAEVTALTRSPASETSFAVRAESLYERAQRQLPPQMRANETANPQLLQATNTRNAVNALRAEQERTRIPGGVVNGRFAGLADRVQTNVTLPTLRSMRTAIGRELANFNYGEMGLDRTQLKALYSAISRDIEVAYQDLANRAHIASRAGSNAPERVNPGVARAADRALYEFRRADRYFRQGIQRMDSFLNVVNANNPELAARRLVQAALSGGKGDIALFRNAMAALRPEERADFASLVIRQMGTPNPSARGIAQEVGFSPNSFATNYQKLDPRARAMLFPGQHGRALDDLFRVANRLSNVERFENVSGSGRMAVNVGGLMTGIGSALAGGWPAVFGTAAGGLGLSYMLSRPAYARWLVRYMELKGASAQRAIRTLDNAAGGTRRAGRGIDAALTAHINKLGQAVQRDPELAQIYQSIATEDGVIEGGDEDGGVEQNIGDQDPQQNQQQQLEPPSHGDAGSTDQRFNPPMRLGGPQEGDREISEEERQRFIEQYGVDPTLSSSEFVWETLKNFGAQAAPTLAAAAIGPIASGASAVARALPTATRAGLTALGITGASSGAGQTDEVSDVDRMIGQSSSQLQQDRAMLEQLVQQRQSLDQQRATAVAERDAQLKGGGGRKAGRGPVYQSKDEEVQRITKEMESLDASISDIRRRTSPEYQADVRKSIEAEQVRSKILDESRKPFEETYPTLARYWWLAPAGAGLLTASFLKGGLGGQISARLQNTRWWDAVNKAKNAKTPTEKAEARIIAERYEKAIPKETWASTARSYGAAASIGAIEGAGVANIPDFHDLFLPAQNPERKAYEEYIKRLPNGHPEIDRTIEILKSIPEDNPARRAALEHFAEIKPAIVKGVEGALEGAFGAAFGTTLGKAVGPKESSRPRPETLGLSAAHRARVKANSKSRRKLPAK